MSHSSQHEPGPQAADAQIAKGGDTFRPPEGVEWFWWMVLGAAIIVGLGMTYLAPV